MATQLDNMEAAKSPSEHNKISLPLAAHVKVENFEFEVPPEAPVFYPTEKEFEDPLAYINKIRPFAENTGICKIKPPSNWQPPFAVDVDKLRFTPRIQRLNELEAKTRVKLNFLDQIAKFWELQGSALRIPMVEKRALDLYTLHLVVQNEGGSDIVTRDRKWAKVAKFMGYPNGKGIGTILKTHYDRLLYPYDVFCNAKGVQVRGEPGSSALKSETEETNGQIQLQSSPGSPNSDISSAKSESPIKCETSPNIHSVGRMMSKAGDRGRRSKRLEYECQELIPKRVAITKQEPDLEDQDKSKELRRLQFYGAGPKMAGYDDKKTKKLTKSAFEYDPSQTTRQPLAKYICHTCGRGDAEESMLLCDGCDDSYHTFCLMPPLQEIPKGDWRCPKCVAVEVSKPTEAFGFEQAQREYSLQQFGEMADQFKSDYFNMPVHLVPTQTVEKEFWRIVSSIDEDVTVEYGADLHTMDHGSGFPTATSLNLLPGDIEYAYSSWNLNNLPVLEGSVLGHINADISGMKVPWMYVGMCFATFCWHNEDHWSYSINYLHWGEPKTWYGVPGSKAENFEETMKKAAPELFQSQPDLLHQLVTIMNPNILMNAGVPVFRTDQNAGEFVVTFPRAYHAGFNQGYNFAEAVNFATADWLRIGRECVQHYSHLRRFCVFSHDELVCKMALDPDKLSPLIAAATYQDMLTMVDTEKRLRKALLTWGVTSAEREAFELLPDDERQCEICKTTCFLSAITCNCSTDMLVCLRHYTSLCNCPPNKHVLRYRYTLDELPRMLQKLKVKAEAFDVWLTKVKNSLDPDVPSTLNLAELKDLLTEAEQKRFPKCELLNALANAIKMAEKCANILRELDNSMARTRTRNSTERKYHLNLEELNLFISEIDSLACVLDESKVVKDLLVEATSFEKESSCLLALPLSECAIAEVEKCIEHGDTICIELPNLNRLRERLLQLSWMRKVRQMCKKSECIRIETLQELISLSEDVRPDAYINKLISELKTLLQLGEEWEERAQAIMNNPQPTLVQDLESLLQDAEDIDTFLPSEEFLSKCLEDIRDWMKRLEEINAAEYYPYINVLEELINRGRQINLLIPELERLDQHIIAAHSWKDKTSRTFLKKNSTITLMEALAPRTSHSFMSTLSKFRKAGEEDPEAFKITDDMEPLDVVNMFKENEDREIEAVKSLRGINMSKNLDGSDHCTFCVCHSATYGLMMQCELCKDWFHSACLPLPKIATMKVCNNFNTTALRMDFKGCKFLCPNCHRSRKPRLETILSLLVSLQKLCVRIPEGEALQCLTERAMTWQDRVKSFLQTEELEQAIEKLSQLSQMNSEVVARQKTEKIISTELKKAASNPDFQQQPLQEMPTGSGMLQEHGDSNSSSDPVVCLKVTSSVSEDNVDDHAYSMHLPNAKGKDCLIWLNDEAKHELEELLIEGDLMEISLDETERLWKLLQASRDAEKEAVLMNFDLNNTQSIQETGPAKRGRKRKSLEPDNLKAKSNKVDTEKKTTKRKPKEGKRGTVGRRKRKDAEKDESDEKCAATSCQLPSGDEVDWVQCDGGCEKWFHMACVGLSAQEINEDEDYICITCSRTNSVYRGLQQPSPECDSLDNPISPDSTEASPFIKTVI